MKCSHTACCKYTIFLVNYNKNKKTITCELKWDDDEKEELAKEFTSIACPFLRFNLL